MTTLSEVNIIERDDIIKNSKQMKFLGSGTFGRVYLYNTPIGEKVIKESFLQDPKNPSKQRYYLGYLKSFFTEIDILTKFSVLENIIGYDGLAFDTKKGIGYIIMEKMDIDVSKWLDMNPNFQTRIHHLPCFILSIGKTLATMNNLNFYHNDLKTNNILIKFKSSNEITFKLIDFGKSVYAYSDNLNYGAIIQYQSVCINHTKIYSKECWAFACCCTEFLLRRKLFKKSLIKSIKYKYCSPSYNPHFFDIKTFLKDHLKPDDYNNIPKMYWDFVLPIFSGNQISIEGCLKNIAYDLDYNLINFIYNKLPKENKFITVGKYRDIINKYIDKIFNFLSNNKKSEKYINIKILEYILLMNKFFNSIDLDSNKKIVDIMDKNYAEWYCEVGYIIVLGHKITKFINFNYFKNKEEANLAFRRYQETFLQICNYQYIILPSH